MGDDENQTPPPALPGRPGGPPGGLQRTPAGRGAGGVGGGAAGGGAAGGAAGGGGAGRGAGGTGGGGGGSSDEDDDEHWEPPPQPTTLEEYQLAYQEAQRVNTDLRAQNRTLRSLDAARIAVELAEANDQIMILSATMEEDARRVRNLRAEVGQLEEEKRSMGVDLQALVQSNQELDGRYNRARAELEAAKARLQLRYQERASQGTTFLQQGERGQDRDRDRVSSVGGGAFLGPRRPTDIDTRNRDNSRPSGNGNGNGNGNGRATVSANQLALIKDFSGTENEDVELWLMNVKRCANAFGWTDHQTAAMVQTRLGGAAARWLRSALKTEAANEHLDRWENDGEITGLKEAILNRFRENVNERGAVEAVMGLQQRSGELVVDFFDRVVLAMDRKNYVQKDKEDPAYREALKRECFTFFAAGLQDDIRLQAMGGPNPPVTAEGLLTAARNAETERRRNKKPKQILQLDEGEKKEEDAYGALTARVDALAARFKRSGGAAAPQLCYNCDGSGHFAAACPEPPRRPRHQATPSSKTKSGGARPKTSTRDDKKIRGRGKAPGPRGSSAPAPAAAPKKKGRRYVHELLEELLQKEDAEASSGEDEESDYWTFDQSGDEGSEEEQEEQDESNTAPN